MKGCMRLTIVGVMFGVAWGAVACSGGTQKAQQPEEPPLLEQPNEQEQAPSSPEVKRGRQAIQAGDFERAEQILAQAHQDAPEDPQAAFYYGVALEGVGKLEEAETAYREAIELTPKLIEASQNLSALLLQMDRAEEALKITEVGLEHAPKDGGLLANRALALDVMRSPEAVAAYDKAVAAMPENGDIRFNYAVVLIINGQKEKGRAQLSKIHSKDPELLSSVAQAFVKLEDFEACVNALDPGIAANPDNAELLARRAVCKQLAKDVEGAKADLEKAVEVDPDSAIAHYYLGRHLAVAKETEQAKQHLQKAVELGEGTPVGQEARRALQGL